MKVLIIKTSSLGDLIHTLPALTDAVAAIPDIRFDWVAEETFAEVPTWHPAVERVIPVAIRRWRKAWVKSWRDGEISNFRQDLRQQEYDLIIDAQGLFKSALLARMARGVVVGLDAESAREPGAARLYKRGIRVARDLHAIERVRSLFAQALGYAPRDTDPDYGIDGKGSESNLAKSLNSTNQKQINLTPTPHEKSGEKPYLVFLHGTTWTTKLWPLEYWVELARTAAAQGYDICLPWGNRDEQERAQQIIRQSGSGELLPRQTLTDMASRLAWADGVVGVDSGLAHLAAALSTPAVTLYGPTRTDLTGARGRLQINLQAKFECAPCMRRECDYYGTAEVVPACFSRLPPVDVWATLKTRMDDGT